MIITSNDWRTQCNDLRSRGKHLWKLRPWSDCELVVGEDRTTVRAHRLILGMASPVLEEYLQKKDPHPLDVDVKVFLNILKYIYTDEILIDSVEMALAIGRTAFKFQLVYLVTVSVVYLKEQMTVENVCLIYDFGKLINDTELIDKSVQFIQRNNKKIIDPYGFIEISLDTLETICMQDTLNVSDKVDLINTIQKYYDLSKSSKKIDLIQMKVLVKHINFLMMKPKEVAPGSGRFTLLSKSHAHDVLSELTVRINDELKMSKGFLLETRNRNQVHPKMNIDKDLIIEPLYNQRLEILTLNGIINSFNSEINQLYIQNIIINFYYLLFKSTTIKQLFKKDIKIKECSIQVHGLKTELNKMNDKINQLKDNNTRLIMQNNKQKVDLEYKIKELKKQLLQYSSICTRSLGRIRDWSSRINGETQCYRISFKTNTPGKLYAVQLPTQTQKNITGELYKEKVHVCVYRPEAVTRTKEEELITVREGDVPYNSIQNVYLKKAITIEKNQEYRIFVCFLTPGYYPLPDTVDNEEQHFGHRTVQFQLADNFDGKGNCLPGLIRGLQIEF